MKTIQIIDFFMIEKIEVPQMIKPDSNSGKVYVKRVSKELLKYLKNEDNTVAFKSLGAAARKKENSSEKYIKNMEKSLKITPKKQETD